MNDVNKNLADTTASLLWLGGLVLTAALAMRSFADDAMRYALRERVRVGQEWRVELRTRVEVEPKASKTRSTVTAEHRFWEHVLALVDVAANSETKVLVHGLRPGLPIRLARYYEHVGWQRQSSGAVAVSHQTAALDKRQLRPEHRLLVVTRHRDETVVFSPSGPMTREELDLTQGHLDMLLVPELLPEDLVAVGDSWVVPIPAVQALCGLDGVSQAQVRAKLASVQNDRATIHILGKVEGIADGSETSNTVEGQLEYDLTFERWTSLSWRQTQQRQIGPITPAMTVTAEIRAVRHFAGQCEHLTATVLRNLPAELAAPYLLLTYRAPNNACEFLYDRGWHRIAQDERFVVFRLLDRGEMVAQMNLTFWADARSGQRLTAQQIRELAEQAPNFQLEKVIESGELPSRDGRWIYRHTVQGKSEDLLVVLTWYAVASPEGRQVVLVFTTEPTLADKLGGRDLAIVQSLTFPPR